MATIINTPDLEFRNDPTALGQFDLLTLSPRLTQIVNSKHFVFDLRKLEAGKYSFPYHFHHNAEELVLTISGSMTIRTPNGFEIAERGQIVFFEMGESGAHQFYNHGTQPCTYLDIRSTVGMDVCEYPDSDKINISPLGEIYGKKSQVDYNKGEEHVGEVWANLKSEHKKNKKQKYEQ